MAAVVCLLKPSAGRGNPVGQVRCGPVPVGHGAVVPELDDDVPASTPDSNRQIRRRCSCNLPQGVGDEPYTPCSTRSGSRSVGSSTIVTAPGARSAALRTAPASPSTARVAALIPCASSRRSASARSAARSASASLAARAGSDWRAARAPARPSA